MVSKSRIQGVSSKGCVVLGQVPTQPRPSRRFVDARQGPTGRILRHELVDPQELRMDRVLTEAGDVRIAWRAQQAMVTGQNRQQEGGEHRPLVRSVVTDVMEWAVLHPGIEHAAHLQEVDEERQLP